jgi:broad specificity phosphatase PhoE
MGRSMHEFTFLSPALCRNTTAVERTPWVKAYWERCDPDYVHGEGAESYNRFVGRINQSLDKISSLGPKDTTVIFTH